MISLSVAARTASVQAVVDLLDGGGTMRLYSGAKPATPATAATGTLLAALPLSAPAFGTASAGSVTANPITADSSTDATGLAGWFRVVDSGGVSVLDGTVGLLGSTADLFLDDTLLVAGGSVTVASWTLSG